jgi:hypothetical protein
MATLATNASVGVLGLEEREAAALVSQDIATSRWLDEPGLRTLRSHARGGTGDGFLRLVGEIAVTR